jgi:chromosome segregation ATPase
MSALSEGSSTSGSGDSSMDVSAAGGGDTSLFQSPAPVIRHSSRRAPMASPPLMSPITAPAAATSSSSTSSAPRTEDDLHMRYSQLKKNFKKQAEELEKTTRELDTEKRTFNRERMELEERIRSIEHKHALLESQYQKAQLEFNHALSVKQNELNGISNALRNAQTQLNDQNPDVLKQIEYVKDDLSDIQISEALYLEYKGIEPNRQTIREYVCCNVYELIRAERAAKEAMQKELELVRIKSIHSEDEADRNARERDQLARLKKTLVNYFVYFL